MNADSERIWEGEIAVQSRNIPEFTEKKSEKS
jgi:hypothetical protein